ncbi:adenine phosphoribosyltransferase [Candidatus Peribacteria bacterium RIFCSPHIGHO2_01_FULL_51_9]|nr:MAG: adenine phosphoribosyltransferase [Candidatus Peribacteria bacterium RIFCSPHIGHO2_01_FULL_51_9]
MQHQELKSFVTRVPDFPKEGITFWDVTSLLQDGEAFAQAIDALAERYRDRMIDKVIAPEARGFIFGAPLAKELKAGFVPMRKPGKLPRTTARQEFDLEYGTDALHMHTDALRKGERVLFVDDVLATGGTALACAKIVESVGGTIEELCFLAELLYLPRDKSLERYKIYSLLQFTDEDLRSNQYFTLPRSAVIPRPSDKPVGVGVPLC